MRILVVHNYYQQAGGEDEVFRAEVALLREHGHEVSTLTTENGAVHGLRGWLRALRRPPLAGEGREMLMAAWRRLGGTVPLYVVGDGPLAPAVQEFVGKVERCHWLGWQPKDKVLALMRDARVLVLPSECYEMFPLVLAEASAAGLPVIGSRHGSVGAIIDDGRTGLRVRPGDPEDLASKVEWAFSHPSELATMRTNAREVFETRYTPAVNYDLLMGIYDRVRNGVAA